MGKIYGESTNHPDIAISLNNIAWAYYKSGQIDDAIDHLEQSRAMLERIGDPHFAQIVKVLESWRNERAKNKEKYRLLGKLGERRKKKMDGGAPATSQELKIDNRDNRNVDDLVDFIGDSEDGTRGTGGSVKKKKKKSKKQKQNQTPAS